MNPSGPSVTQCAFRTSPGIAVHRTTAGWHSRPQLAAQPQFTVRSILPSLSDAHCCGAWRRTLWWRCCPPYEAVTTCGIDGWPILRQIQGQYKTCKSKMGKAKLLKKSWKTAPGTCREPWHSHGLIPTRSPLASYSLDLTWSFVVSFHQLFRSSEFAEPCQRRQAQLVSTMALGSRNARAARLLSTLYLSSRRLVSALPSLMTATNHIQPMTMAEEEPEDSTGSPNFWFHIGLSAFLVLLGGVFAGLTLGLMGLDELHLKVLAASSENPRERSNASKGMCNIAWFEIRGLMNNAPVLRLLERKRHWVLVVGIVGLVMSDEG